MTRLITVVGATGIQGGSVVKSLLGSPTYSIRAITRNAKSDAAKALASQGIEVVEADVNNVDSLKAAFAGSQAIYAMTNFFEAVLTLGIERSMDTETRQGINLAEAAAATPSLEHYVWSTLPNTRLNTNGALAVPYYESKNRVDAHIRASLPQLLAKTTFFCPAWYAGNMSNPVYHPNPVRALDGSKQFVHLLTVPPSTLCPSLGDEAVNTGLFVKAILEQPQKTLPGRSVAGVAEYKTFDEVFADFASVHNITSRTIEVSREGYVELWPVFGVLLDLSHKYLAQLGNKSFSTTDGDEVTAADLGIEGLVKAADTFSKQKLVV
jgi:hypothetical protein